jgi:hypothetical protein
MNGRKAKALRKQIYGDHSIQQKEQVWSVSKILKLDKTDSKGKEIVIRKGTVRSTGRRAAYQAAKKERSK